MRHPNQAFWTQTDLGIIMAFAAAAGEWRSLVAKDADADFCEAHFGSIASLAASLAKQADSEADAVDWAAVQKEFPTEEVRTAWCLVQAVNPLSLLLLRSGGAEAAGAGVCGPATARDRRARAHDLPAAAQECEAEQHDVAEGRAGAATKRAAAAACALPQVLPESAQAQVRRITVVTNDSCCG